MAWTTPGTATAGSVLTASFLNTNLRDNLNVLAPFASAWTSWVPTVTGSGFTITQGNSTVSGSYCTVGKFVTFWATWSAGSTTSFGAGSGALILSLPATAKNVTSLQAINVSILDSGTRMYSAMVAPQDSTTSAAYIYPQQSDSTYLYAGVISSTTPMTWAVNDTVRWAGTYEAA